MERSTAGRLHSLAIRVLRRARTADAASGMSAARLSVLSVLVFGGTLTVTELAAAEQVAVPTMTRLLQGLEADGYLRRRRDAQDGRVVRVSATARGRRVLEAARSARIELIDEIVAAVPAADRVIVDRAVSVLERALVQDASARRVHRSRNR